MGHTQRQVVTRRRCPRGYEGRDLPLARRARKWALDLAAPPPAPVAAADVDVVAVAVAVAAIVVLGVDVDVWRGAVAADDGLLTARGMSAVGGFIDTGLRVRCPTSPRGPHHSQHMGRGHLGFGGRAYEGGGVAVLAGGRERATLMMRPRTVVWLRARARSRSSGSWYWM